MVTAPVYTPLASVDDMTGTAYSVLLRGTAPAQQQSVMVRASRAIESRCTRRLSPFTGIVQTERAQGVDTFTAGYAGPLPLLGAIGQAQAAALGGLGDQVRDVWLDEHAPTWPELWTYSDVSVTVAWPWGGGQTLTSDFEGPEPDTGHLRLPLGAYCPVGSTIRVTYSGGYTLGTPDELREAALLQAAKFLIVRMEPQARPGMDTADLEAEIVHLLADYART